MRKVPKSLQAIIITFIIGMFVPKIFDLTGIALVDKVFWKIILSLSFNLKDYENYEFLYINVFDIKPSADPFDDEEMAIQTSMEIWAKELK